MLPNAPEPDALRAAIRAHRLATDEDRLPALTAMAGLSAEARARISAEGAALVTRIRAAADPGRMEVFLAEYGLSTQEGIALMCLAEALLRVPDAVTIDALIEDKIAPGDWARHLGHSASPLVNASTWALLLTGKVLEEEEPGLIGSLRAAVRRLGEPVIRTAVGRAMKEMGRQFVLGRTIEEAMERAAKLEARGYTYSYDMLGEAAKTDGQARAYHLAYSKAISTLAPRCASDDIRANPGISVKLSALHPRYEQTQKARVMAELVPRVEALAALAKSAGMGFNIDAEEADRLDLSLDVIEAVLSDPALKGWDGFGVVVQAFGPRAPFVIDWLHALATRLDRKIMVRLVKGAYWDTEIKLAQVTGIGGFPVFTRKPVTDVSYIACARKLLDLRDRIYPQFATHNAHTVAAIRYMAGDSGGFEFQRLHGMGEALHELVRQDGGTRCRIYAPVGAHRDLLAYLVRRLLENGANSSFVNQIVDVGQPAEKVAADPFDAAGAQGKPLKRPAEVFLPDRANAVGWNLFDPADADRYEAARAPFAAAEWEAGPVLAGAAAPKPAALVGNPARPGDTPGLCHDAGGADVETALAGAAPWDAPPDARAAVLRAAARLYEENAGEIFALVAREAGKTPFDAVAELREAVDFLYYYAERIAHLGDRRPLGTVVCISPWNFPLAIFTGQVAAALAAGNAVIAKPAETTPLIAALAVRLLHAAGVPRAALQLLPGPGSEVGAALVADPRVAGVAFTGSTATAQRIHRALAATGNPDARLIAETGGLNAMIVDSTALPEQAVRDIVASSFQSAGQRCSALRMLYLQEDVADEVLKMLYGAMDTLKLGDPWAPDTDVGPVITAAAQADMLAYIAKARDEGRVRKQLAAPAEGHFVPPTVITVPGIADLEREVFGPVLHVATFRAEKLDAVVDAVNASGYGLTFGLHTRIDARVQQVVDRLHVGNIYVNRNQIGAIVGSQPFGGEGLSGTGPKAGGPSYLDAFTRAPHRPVAAAADGPAADPGTVAKALAEARRLVHGAPVSVTDLPGPAGESNRLSRFPRGVFLCLGPDAASAEAQMAAVRESGNIAVGVAPGLKDGLAGVLDPAALATLGGFDGVLFAGDGDALRPFRQALAARHGPILPLVTDPRDSFVFHHERHVCVDTTAAGGNAQLLAL